MVWFGTGKLILKKYFLLFQILYNKSFLIEWTVTSECFEVFQSLGGDLLHSLVSVERDVRGEDDIVHLSQQTKIRMIPETFLGFVMENIFLLSLKHIQGTSPQFTWVQSLDKSWYLYNLSP